MMAKDLSAHFLRGDLVPRSLFSAALASVAALIITSLAVGTATVRAADPLQIGDTGERNGDTITFHAVGEGDTLCYVDESLTTAYPPCAVGEGAVISDSPYLFVDLTYCVGSENPPVDPHDREGGGLDDLVVGNGRTVTAPVLASEHRYPGDDVIQEPLSDPIAAGDCARGFVLFSDERARQLIWGELTALDDAVVWQISGPIPTSSVPASLLPSPSSATEGPEQSTSPQATQAPAAPPDGEPGGVGDVPFAAAVASPDQISTDPIVLLQSAALAALLVFLMPFPSQLFNSTLEAHEDEVRHWLRLDRIGSAVGRLGAFWGSWPGVSVFTLTAALLYGFLDPGFGFSLGSLATFVGMLVGIVLVTAAFAVPVVLAHRRLGDRWQLKVVPVSLLIGVACVLLSRLTGFQPGYLYGLLIGLAFARELSAAAEGRATALGAAVMLAVAFAAWLGLGALPEGDAFGLVVLRTALAALMVAGLEGVVFGLLPMRFLPGEPLYASNRILWGVLLAIGAFAFFHILINPASGYLSDSSRTPLFTELALLIGFSLVSVAFWAWFRFRRPQSTAAV